MGAYKDIFRFRLSSLKVFNVTKPEQTSKGFVIVQKDWKLLPLFCEAIYFCAGSMKDLQKMNVKVKLWLSWEAVKAEN